MPLSRVVLVNILDNNPSFQCCCHRCDMQLLLPKMMGKGDWQDIAERRALMSRTMIDLPEYRTQKGRDP